jgi:multidrug transporter EmrE-like cation transporter
LLVNVIASNYFGNNRYSFNEIFCHKRWYGRLYLNAFIYILFLFCIPISTAYAIWEGIGLIGTATVAYFIFNEDLSLLKVLAFMVILSGLIMIKKGTYTVSNK